MKRSMFVLIASISLISLFGISNTNADEVLVNKEGNPVLLKDDGTWELIPDEGEDGKVVFMIKEGRNYAFEHAKEDEMGDFSHYRNYVGCYYTITIKNKSKHKAKVNMFKLALENEVVFRKRLSLIQLR